MASPRLFVSSTCYDLQEIRFQLRNFIQQFGYDAVMSEFDDIFYSYESHVQDSCLEEISKCQLFILVIGNNYGSFYHQDVGNTKIPDSVTLKEFRKALEVKVYKHIFINKYVDYDYKNYKRALDKATLKYFQENNVEDTDVEDIKSDIKIKFDNSYHFPYESYKYVFYFLDIINELKDNNAINPFESFSDIKETLTKQWAGFMYEALSKKDKIVQNIIEPLESKIEKIEKSLSKLIEIKTETNDNKLTFDLNTLIRENNIESLEAVKDKLQELLFEIRQFVYLDLDGDQVGNKISFNKKFTIESTQQWLDSLKIIIQSFKWSKNIHVENLFRGYGLSKYNKWHNEIPYKTLFDLYNIYSSLNKNDKEGFANTVCQELNQNFVQEKKVASDDLPF